MNSIPIESPDYPACLEALGNQAPKEIYYLGNLDLIKPEQSISIVGTRKLSPIGRSACQKFIASLASLRAPAKQSRESTGLLRPYTPRNDRTTIVSGLAYGLDSCAHQAALDQNLPTIAVIASGLNCFEYSGEQRIIWDQMRRRDDCLIITETPPNHEAKKWSFAHRNRIIAALSHTTLVIEAPLKSGALITADWAYQLERNLLVLPGQGPNYRGSNKLIEAGIAQELQLEQNPTGDPILDLLPCSFDLLQNKLGINSRELTKQLSLLELEGKINKERGSYYPKVLENKSL